MDEYKVQGGDTLSKIADRHDTTVEELQRVNEIDNPNLIKKGQSLTIPGTETEGTYYKSAKQAFDTAIDTFSGIGEGLGEDAESVVEAYEGELMEGVKKEWYDALDESYKKHDKDSIEADSYRHYKGSRDTVDEYGILTSAAAGLQHEAVNVYDFLRGKYADDYTTQDLAMSVGMDLGNNALGIVDEITGREPRGPDERYEIKYGEYKQR